MKIFENRIAEYLRVFEKRKHKKSSFADQKAKNEKILYVINHIDWFWSHRLPLAKGAQDAGHDVHVAVNGAENDKKLGQNSFKGHDIPEKSIIKIVLDLNSIIKSEKPAIIHAITLKYAFICGILSLFYPKICFIHTIAGLGYVFSGNGFKPKLLRAILSQIFKIIFQRKNTKLIFQNPDDQNIFLSRHYCSPEQCYLIRGSGVDLQQFPFTPEPENNPPIILMPTRLLHDKGIAVFIEAAKILEKDRIQARMQIAGGISETNPAAISEQDMQSMLKGSNVEWLGKVSNMPALYASCTCVAYPSYYREGVPKVLLEAAATGRAIITTNHPGCREAVNDGENGLLIPVKDAVALAEAIKNLLEHPKLRHTMGQKSRTLAEDIFDVKKIVKETLKVYE